MVAHVSRFFALAPHRGHPTLVGGMAGGLYCSTAIFRVTSLYLPPELARPGHVVRGLLDESNDKNHLGQQCASRAISAF